MYVAGAMLVGVVSLAIAVLAVVLLPFLAAYLHIPYTIDNASLTTSIGALGGLVGAIILNYKKSNDQNTKQ